MPVMKDVAIIGLTLDREEGADGAYSRWPYYALRQNYCDAVVRAGGLPVALPHETAEVERYVAGLDGLIVTGGAFDVDPVLFGAGERHPSIRLKAARTAFELAAARAALARDLPLLGICGGAQLLAVACGGSLIQHIPDEVENALEHEQKNPRDQPGHEVELAADSLLRHLAQSRTLAVNSAHHQAVKEPGEGLRVSARAPDGVVEGIEAPGRRFCLGVQWHPEFAISSADEALFDALVAACA